MNNLIDKMLSSIPVYLMMAKEKVKGVMITARRVGYELLDRNEGVHLKRKYVVPNNGCVMMLIVGLEELSNEYGCGVVSNVSDSNKGVKLNRKHY